MELQLPLVLKNHFGFKNEISRASISPGCFPPGVNAKAVPGGGWSPRAGASAVPLGQKTMSDSLRVPYCHGLVLDVSDVLICHLTRPLREHRNCASQPPLRNFWLTCPTISHCLWGTVCGLPCHSLSVGESSWGSVTIGFADCPAEPRGSQPVT